MKKLFLSILLILLLSFPVFGATVWTTNVTPTGSGGSCADSGECSQAEFEVLNGDYGGSTFTFIGTFNSQVDVGISGTSTGAMLTLNGDAATIDINGATFEAMRI